MPLVYACIAPHGSEAIEQLASKKARGRFRKTRNGLRRLAKEAGRSKPDTIVLATPHNIRLWKRIGIVLAEHSTGRLQASPRNRKSVSLRTRCDVEFAKQLLERSAKTGLPVTGANYGTSEGSTSDMQMDWGTLVPLWFMIPRCRKKPKLLIVTPSREIPLANCFRFGQCIADIAQANRKKRIVFVASADQAHAHKKSGPYGYNKWAKEYDSLIVNALTKNQIADIMRIKP